MNFDKFRKNLKIVRNCKGITATELAVNCKLRQQKRIMDIEQGRGKLTLEEVYSICKGLDVSIDNMIDKDVNVNFNWS